MKSLYVKSAVWDALLVALSSIAMSYTLLNGFYVSESLQYSPFPAVVVVVCLVALFALSSSRKYLLVGGIAYGVVLVVALFASAAATPVDALYVDNESNYLIFIMVVCLTATAGFLFSRTRVGSALWFIVGSFLIGFIQLFYARYELGWTIVFVISAISLLIYKNYQLNLKRATSVEKISFVPGFVAALAATAVAVGLGLLIWFLIIAPLNPGAVEIKLITEYRALETVQVRGTSEEYQIPNLDITSDVTNDDFRTTDDEKEADDGERIAAKGDASSQPNDGESAGTFMGMNLDSLDDAFDMQSNPQNWPLLVLLVFPIFAIVMYFVLRRAMRNRRFLQMRKLGPEGEYEQMFLYLLGKFKRLGIAVPPGQTVLEFGVSSQNAMYQYNAVSGVEFKDLATSYATMLYGIRPVDEGDVEKIEKFYKGFWKAARKQLGSFRYFFKSFRL